jgi:hypothetical protein
MPWEALAWMAFWSWVVFLGGADRIATDGWVMAYLVEPLPKKVDPVHMLRLIGIVNLIVGAIVLVWVFF